MARILVVDDMPEIRDVLKTALEEFGYEVALACEGGDALRQHADTPADVVITDLHMPGMNGLDTVRAFREKHGAVKIIAMTGAETFMVEKNLESSRINGADFTLTKPFELGALLKAIRELLVQC
jgi:CheY-like chemotaxis protein